MKDTENKWEQYHSKKQAEFFKDRWVKSIRDFSDDEKIKLAEAGAGCYHPDEDEGWDTRIWLEEIHCVLHHGCCTGCKATELCAELSKSRE